MRHKSKAMLIFSRIVVTTILVWTAFFTFTAYLTTNDQASHKIPSSEKMAGILYLLISIFSLQVVFIILKHRNFKKLLLYTVVIYSFILLAGLLVAQILSKSADYPDDSSEFFADLTIQMIYAVLVIASLAGLFITNLKAIKKK
jgi:hypothetical protein